MSLSNRSVSNSPTASILLKAKRFSIFSIFTLTAIIANPLLAKAQIAVDGSTATEVKGNMIAPAGQGTVNGGNLYHSFDKFNVPNSGVIFNTGNSSVDGTKVNNIINRVTGDTPSSILGTIESRSAFPNANLYLLNPNGVVFSPNARLDIGGSFHVTTGTSLGFDQNQKFSVDKNSLSFPSGDPKNIQFAIAQPAAIINQGNLTVDAGKNISVTAGTVINSGNLTAPNGNVNVAAVSGNSQVELRSPDLVLGFAVNKDVIPTNWNGAIATLPKLAESLTGQASQANQVVVKPDGTIALVASPSTSDIAVKDGMNITSGKIDVSSSTGKGGNVGVFGNQVGLVNSFINASGNTGGGTVLIGGDLQGKGILPNALQTYVDSRSQIFANGLLTGDGGKVIVWADRSTQFLGAIAAKGGDVSGDGGFVEVSGKENLDYRGSTNTLAPRGKIGTLLLDPTDITIIDTTGNSSLTNVSAFANLPTNALLSNLTINAATANVLLQATNNIVFNANINITSAGVGLTAQAGNSIISDGFGNGTITTNGGNVSLIANDPAFATGTGNITLGGDITTNGGNINLAVNNGGRLLIESTAQLKSGTGNITLESKTTTGTNSGISINGNVIVGATPSTGSILIDASSTSLDAVSFGANTQVIADAGSITINGVSATANGIRSVDGVRIQSATGAIALTGISNGGTGDGVVLQGGNTIAITNNGSNISISGNAANSTRTGLNITGTALSINSGTGNMTFTSDRSIFPNLKFSGSGNLTLQPFTTTAALDFNSSVTNTSNSSANVFLDSSFLTTLALSNDFSNVVIGNVSSNSEMSLINSLNINANTAPISILTARTFNANGNDITSNAANLTLIANQGITNLGNITTAGGNVSISSATGDISAATSTTINTSSIDNDGGNISITANNGGLSLQNLNSSTTNGDDDSNAGNIALTVAGNNNISIANVIASRNSTSNGNAGNLSFAMGTGNITLTGNNIDLSASGGKGGSVTFPNPVILAGTPLINSFSVNTRGTTSSGNVIFENALTSPSPTGSRLSVLTSSGNITFNSTVGLSTAPLAQFLLDSDNTITLANTVFASSFTSNQGLTVINRNIVATGTFVPSLISLGNFTLNGDISLIGDEINLVGTGTNTALGNITLKPFTTGQAIAIGGTGDTGTGTLDLLATDISKFGAGGSLTIGHESGTGAISFAGATTFNRPTTVRSPVGAGNVTINNNIAATGNLTVQAGNAIAITNNAQITSSGGALSVILNSDRDADNSGKISIASGSLINSNGGDIVFGGGINPLTTPAVFASFADSGVTINGSVNAAGGNITLNGSNTNNTSGNNVGVHISSGGQVLTNGTGNITIAGTGGIGFTNNQGIEILGTGSLVQTVNGNITLIGTTGGSSSNNDGIRITDNAIVRTTGTGNLNLTGTSNATGTNGTGILMAGAVLETTGSGNITLTGTSGTGTSNNTGIRLGNTASLLGEINAASGAITLTGNSRGTTSNNQGVLLDGNITVNTNGNNEINVIGTGGNGINNNMGILVSFSSSLLSVRNGNLNLTGTGRGTGTGNDGVFVSSGIVDAIGTGNINFTGVAPTGSFGINLFNASIKPSNTSGNLTLIANEMDARGTTNSISGTGNLFIEPATATRNIIVGGASNASDTNLEINDILLAGLQTGFAQVFIGRTDSSGLISLGSDLVFNNPVTLRSPLTTGAINTSGFNFRNITGNVTFLANQNITAGNIIASGNTTSLTSTSGAIDTSSGTIDTSADGNGGNISFSSATGSTVGSLNTASTVTGNAGAIAFTSGNITLAGSSIDVSSNNGNSQNLTFGFPVTLSNSNLTINTGSLSGTNGAVTFSNVVNGSTAGVNNLTINSGSGSIAFNNSVGSSTIPLGAIFVNSTDTTRFNSTVNAASLNTNASGTIALNGNVTTTTSQIYNGAVNFTNALQLTSTNNHITFNSTVNGNQNVTVTSGTGNITFGGAVGSSSNPLGNLVANSTVITRFNSTVDAASLTTSAGGTTELNGNITTSGTQTFNDAVSLTNAVQLNTTNSAIAFGSTVNGTQNLTLNSGTANISFAGAVGNIFPLGNIISNTTESGVTAFNGAVNAASLTTNIGGNTELNGNVTTSGSQTYNDQVILQNAVLLSTTNSPISFNNLVNGARNLTVSTGTANITFAGAVGNFTPLLALTTTSTGTITFTNPVIANSITSNSGTTVINGNLTANGANGNGITLRNFTANGDIALIGDELNLLGTGSGTGNLSIVPFTSGQAIVIGGAGETVNTTLDLTASDLTALSGGTFSSLTIGNSLSTSAITLAGNANFAQRTTIQSPVGAGSINTLGFSLTNTGGSITLSANQNVTTGNITAAGNAIAITSTSGVIDTSLGSVSSSALGDGGDISYEALGNITTAGVFSNSTSNGNAGSIILRSANGSINTVAVDATSIGGNAANITFNAQNGNFSNSNRINANTNSTNPTSSAGSFTINALNITNIGSINLSANAGRAGDINLSGNLPLTSNTTFSTNSGGISGNINLGGATVTGNQSLTLIAGSGNVTLGAIGTNTTPLTSLDVTSGSTTLNNDIFVANTLTFNSPVILLSGVALTTTNSAIAFNGGLNGNQALTLNSGTGNITFGGAAGSTLSSLGSLTANSTGITRFNSTVNAASLTTNAGGTTELNGNITTSGTQTFNDAVTLTNAVQLNTTNSAIAFNSTVDGANNLTTNSGTATTTFSGAVGSTTALASLATTGNTTLTGNVTTTGTQAYNNAVNLAGDVTAKTTNSAIAFNNLVNGARNLTVSTGTANITFAGAVGNLQPLLALTTTSTGTITFTNPVIANSITSNSGTTVINGNLTANGVHGNGISLGRVIVNGDISLIGDELNLSNTVSGTGNLIIAPFTSGQAIAIGGAGETINTTFDLTASDLTALSGGTFKSLTIGDSLGTSAITLAGDVSFAQPTIIQSPIGSGSINNPSGFNLTNTGGSLTLLANQNITTGNITAAGNVISLTSTSGEINTSAGRVSTATNVGNAGSITFQAFGNITTGSGTTPNPAIASFVIDSSGNRGSISFTSSNGAINTSLGDIDAGGGNITFVARNNITTSGVFSRASNGGTISLTSQTGAINTSAGDVTTTTTDGRGTGGNITLTANGSVTTKGVFATGDDGKIVIDSTTGSIDTTSGSSSLASVGTNNSITLTARQNILTRDIFASGQNTSLSITSTAGLINTSLGTLNTSGTTGDAGSISLNAGASSIIGNLNASSTVGNAGAIAFNISGNTTFTGSDINGSSATGSATNINFSSVILNTPSLVINTSGGTNSGSVTFSGNLNGTTANVNNLSINAGAGDINFEQIGNTVPLGFLSISTSGTTSFNTVRAGSIQTLNGGSGGAVKLLGNITTNGNIAFNGAASVASNIVLNSSAGNGPIFFNGAIANNVSGTPSNITLNAGTGNIEINQGMGSSGDRFGNITVTNAGNFSTGSGVSIFANSFRQVSGTGRTNFGGNDTFTGDLTATTENFSVDEGATLIARNVTINALNGFRSNPASRLEITGSNSEGFFSGSININSDSNSDGIGTFLNRGTITDSGLGGNVTVRAAILDITGSITAKDIFLSPSTTAPTIAIGSSATGTFRLEDTAIEALKARNLISIAANNGNVNIGSTQAFDSGTSLEIGTTASPANTITANPGSTLSVTRNLSATGTTIALGNTTVGGNLALTGNDIVLSDTTANNLTLRLRNQVSQTGTVNVVGQTNLIIDTNPLTNVLLADFANNFGSSITLSFANLSTTSFNNLEFRTVSNGAQFNVAPQQINNLKLILDNGTIALSSIPLTGSLTLSARDVSVVGNITATSASLTSLNGGNVTINNNFTTTAGDLAIANSGLLTVNSGIQLNLQGALVQSGTGAVQFGGNIDNSTRVSFAAPIALIGNSIINSSGNVTFTSTVNGARSLTVNTGGITLFNRAVGETTPLTDITTDAAGTTQINGNVITSGSQNFNDRVLISSNSFLDSSRGNGNINLGNIANAIAGTPINLNLNAGQGNIVLRQVGTTSDPFGNITISNAGDVSTGSLNTARNLSFTANTIAFGNTTVAGNLAIAPTTKVSQTGPMSVTGTTSFILNQSSPDILLANFSNNSFNGGISFPPNGTSSNLKVGNFELINIASGTGLNTFPASATNVRLIFANGSIALPSVTLTGNLDLSAKDISLNGAITALSASLTGGNITINNSVTTSSGSLAIANSGTFSLNPNANLDLSGNLLLSGGGTTAIGGNITRSSSIDFVQPVLLSGNSNIVSDGNITFEKSINGAFALNLDTNGNFVVLSGAIGDTTPLTSFAIAPNSTLSSRSNSVSTTISFAPINISTIGNISLGVVNNLGEAVTLSSSTGSITTSSITTRSTIGNAGNVELTANGNVTTSDIDASSLPSVAAGSNGGSVNVTSRTGQISTGNITTTAQTGGEIFINASTAIDVGILNSSGSIRAGDVTLDPVGDVVVRAIDASSATQGGNVTLVSTGGNLRITDTLLSSTTSSCVGASICTSGGTGGNISLQTGGLNPFLVDNATLNGSKGFLTTGTTTLNLGTSIPVILSSSFIQGGIKITPGGVITSTPTDSTQPFVTPVSSETVSTTPSNGDNNKSLGNADVFKKEAARYLEQGNLPRAFDSLERSYGSELESFLGRPLNLPSITIDESQDVLAKVAQQTGDVAALIYPVLLDNRIEIMVVPPKDKGKPFRKFSVVPSQEAVESILTDYRNNIRDVGSNDYLEQSQVLYDLIMRPIDTQLKAMKINTLVFVMDAGLRVVPPAAMHDGKQFVVERYGIASVASMRVTKIEERDRKSTRVLAMGLTDAVSGFSALPSVDVEIKTIASNVLEGSSFLNQDFTVSNLQAQRQLGKYTILHLGTHGKFVSDNSGESFIQFWDSRLSLSEIPELRFDNPAIDMLTLSACQTAVGNNLGISGLAVESGAKSVLASLWEVSDAGTAPLMISFYKAFPDAINKAQAMQKAQVSLLSGKVNIQNGQITGILGLPNVQLPAGIGDIDLSHPFYWSSFILVGNWL